MADIDWDKAPEGTTHYLESLGWHSKYWLRREGDLYHWLEVGRDGQFKMNKAAVWSEAYENPAWYVLIERPPIEADLPNGLVWPEGATHFYSNNVVPILFIFDGLKYSTSKNGNNKIEWRQDVLNWYLAQEQTIARYGAQPQVDLKKQQPKAEVKPEPKRQVGWWA